MERRTVVIGSVRGGGLRPRVGCDLLVVVGSKRKSLMVQNIDRDSYRIDQVTIGAAILVIMAMILCSGCSVQWVPDEVTGHVFHTRGDGTATGVIGGDPHSRFGLGHLQQNVDTQAWTLGVSATYDLREFKRSFSLTDRVGGHRHRSNQ